MLPFCVHCISLQTGFQYFLYVWNSVYYITSVLLPTTFDLLFCIWPNLITGTNLECRLSSTLRLKRQIVTSLFSERQECCNFYLCVIFFVRKHLNTVVGFSEDYVALYSKWEMVCQRDTNHPSDNTMMQ